MPANLDSMMYTGEMPWHRSGTRLDNPATAEEAMVAAGLAWEVQKQPLYTGPDRDVRVKDRYVVCRMDRLEEGAGGQLGIVGRDYEPLQNRQAFGFLDPVVGQAAAIYHTAGSLQEGRRVWMLAKLPGEIHIIGDDVAEKYVLLSNSHDGTSAVRIGLTPIRVVCQNTLNLALGGMQGLTIRHFADVAQRVHEAHDLLGIVRQRFDHATTVMRNMTKVSLGTLRVSEFFNHVMPVPKAEDEPGRKAIVQRHNRLAELFEVGDGNHLPGVRGTLWAAYNAVTQWADRESYTKRHKEPLKTIWFGNAARVKEYAFEVAEDWTKASLN